VELRGTALSDLAGRFTELVEALHIELQGITGNGLAELLQAASERPATNINLNKNGGSHGSPIQTP